MPSDIKKINEKSIDVFSDFGGLIKHTARCLLWLPEAHSLRREKNRFLKYFTLPGRWAWDVLFFDRKNIIEKGERGFPGVRFCDNNVKSYTDAKRLLGNTIGKKGNFERLVLNNQPEFWDGFPYDLYNLDFCGTCFPDDQPPFSETFGAIAKIIENHVTASHFPFVIFLTMKALDSQTNEEAKTQLKENIETNRGNQDFADRINNLIPDVEHFVRSNFVDFIIVSVPKIICHLAESQCDVEVKTRAKYSRSNPSDGNFFITKFVFKFTRGRSRSLRVRNNNYINNVLEITRLDNIQIINNSSITNKIKTSLDELKRIKRSFEE